MMGVRSKGVEEMYGLGFILILRNYSYRKNTQKILSVDF